MPDIHVPNHETLAVNSVLKFIKFYKPTHLVQLGDFCDWDSLSNYEAKREKDIANLEHEIRESNTLLDQIDEAVPSNCERFMVGGNHEARYERFRVNHGFEVSIRRLKDFSNWYHEYNLPSRCWKWCEYGETTEIGKIVFTHGWFVGGNHAQRHLNLWHKNLFYGHTHQLQIATGSGLDGKPVMAASLGTLSKFNLSYLVGKPPVNWIHSFAYIDMREDGSFTPHFVPIVDGRFYELGREFGP